MTPIVLEFSVSQTSMLSTRGTRCMNQSVPSLKGSVRQTSAKESAAQVSHKNHKSTALLVVMLKG